jgi:S-methylmethionine-dependent homocysteine/selenocysteine methylase
VPDSSASLFRARLRSGPPPVLDAALGTDLLARGARLPAPLWSAQALLDAPDLVETIHRENAEAGADVLTIASFRLHRRNLDQSVCSLSQRELIARALTLAQRAASEVSSKVKRDDALPETREEGRRAARSSRSATRPSKKIFNGIAIAGSLAPLEDCYRPDRVPSEAEISSEHHEMARELARAGVDLILVETMNTVREAAAAARAAAATGLPTVVSCVTDGRGCLLSGESVEAFARALLALPSPPDALGINCVAAGDLAGDLARLAAAAPGVPLAAYGNTFAKPVSPEDYAALAAEWVRLGARLAGGCCGTTAAHTAAVARRFRGNSPGSSSRGASGS